MFNRASAGVRRLVLGLLPPPLRRGYHRYALLRDFGIDPGSARRRASPVDPELPRGINFIGWFDSPTGVGQSLRSLARSAESAGIPIAKIDAAALESGQPAPAPYALNLFHVNAEAAASIVQLCGPAVHRGHANVGYWYWETDDFPRRWRDRFAYFDEIWVASEFCRAAIEKVAEIPVVVVPPPVLMEGPPRPEPGPPIGEPAPFRFLTVSDAESVAERKNPHGAVRAFARAFPEDRSVSLTVKISNADRVPGLVRELQRAAGGARVEIDALPAERGGIERLLAGCDAYVSLHRSEGFGLPIAEAMALGKPVVATDYSGSTDFLDETTGYPVKWRPAVLDRARGPYPAGTKWAEPDEVDAARILADIVRDGAEAARRGEAARRRIQARYGLERSGRRVEERLSRVLARLAARP
ncbi:MAG TPA: glycosyltransferase [Thermoanaerobaculia bacterium]